MKKIRLFASVIVALALLVLVLGAKGVSANTDHLVVVDQCPQLSTIALSIVLAVGKVTNEDAVAAHWFGQITKFLDEEKGNITSILYTTKSSSSSTSDCFGYDITLPFVGVFNYGTLAWNLPHGSRFPSATNLLGFILEPGPDIQANKNEVEE